MAAIRQRQRSVHWLLPLLPALLALVLLALLVAATDRIVGSELTRRAEARVNQTAELYADRIERVLARRAVELELVAVLAGTDVPQDLLGSELSRLKSRTSGYVWIGITDLDGVVRLGTNALLEGVSIATRPVFINGSQGLWFGSFHPPKALIEPLKRASLPVPAELADLALPVVGANGQLQGVVAAHLDAAFFDRLIQEVLGPASAQRSLQLALVDDAGKLLLGALQPDMGENWSDLLKAAPGKQLRHRGADGRWYVLTRSAVNPADSSLRPGWQVVASQPLDAVLLPVRELQRTVLPLGSATVLIMGAAGFWLSRRLARPYSQMLDAVADQLGPQTTDAPDTYLRVISEQLRRLPKPGSGNSPGEHLLAQVLYDTSRLQAVLQHLPAPVYLVDDDFRVVFWNLACEKVFGWTAAEAHGRYVSEVLPSASGGQERDAIRAEVVAGRGPWEFVGHMLRRDGSEMWGDWRLIKVAGVDGRSFGVLAQVHDLTAERHEREQGEVFAAVINSASDAVISVDVQGCISLFNPAAERIFGRAADTMLGQNLDILLPVDDRDHHRGYMHRFADSRATTRPMAAGQVRGLHANGELLELEASISQVTVRGRKLLTAILRDVSERVRSEQALAQYRRELSDLAQRLLDQEKDTTHRLAQTLHDKLGQTLSATRLSFDVFSRRAIDQLDAREQDRMRSIGQLVEQSVQEVRQALVELRPPLLESLGLQAALDNEVRARSIEAELVVITLEVSPDAEGVRWPPEVEYAAFMIAREATGNALLHASAGSIELRLDGDAGRLSLSVSDDGIGLHGSLMYGRPGHLGMVGMRERALAIGGQLAVQGSPSGGTVIALGWTVGSDSFQPPANLSTAGDP
ncbi:sensory box protein [Hydrogenophaga sp. RAC07]|uniref:sensor histidine kinase n=1 Tax=Hydrogenophaga sp. RAC07 TaxID=1842537 RepID=UPI00083DB7EC|nr:PAS domain S-box protein [Hydrogenophaga sp. RAC07]AOF84983.1 sensory box protein [Hydrogenophaga sp. RAC07]